MRSFRPAKKLGFTSKMCLFNLNPLSAYKSIVYGVTRMRHGRKWYRGYEEDRPNVHAVIPAVGPVY